MLYKREWTDGIEHTAKSFKNWDSCMADKPCKIIAIVGIVLASIIGLWLIGSLLTCIRQGFSGIGGFICWCCNSNDNSKSNAHQQYSAQPPPNVVYQPVEPGYYGNRVQGYDQGEPQYYNEAGSYNNNNRSSIFELEEDFDLEGQRKKSAQSRGFFQRS